MADAHKNFAFSTVATAPSPASSGTSLVVAAGDGAKFPAVPFNAFVFTAGANPYTGNCEIVRVTGISTDTFTIARNTGTETVNQARSIVVGDQIVAGLTAKTLTDAEVNCDVQVFTTTGANTWTKPAGAKSVHVQLIAAGGGGGSGRRGAAGSARFGGGGASGGGIAEKTFQASYLGSTETVTVGAGGAGGTAQSVNDTDGNNGVDGGPTSFGGWLKAAFGLKGGGGTAAAGAAGAAVMGYPDPGVFATYGQGGASSTSATAGAGINPTTGIPPGGGGGGGLDTGNTPRAGGAGGGGLGTNGYATAIPGGAGGTVGAGQAGTPGTAITALVPFGGSGGGGGAANASAAAGAGAAGGKYGAGGGGGGASVNGQTSGVGGAGADGLAIITTYY